MTISSGGLSYTASAGGLAPAPFQTLTDAATINWDVSQGANASVTLAGNRVVAAPTNASEGQTIGITLTQDDVGGRTVTWDPVFRHADNTPPTLTTTAGYSDYVDYKYNGMYFLEINRAPGLKLFEDPPPPDTLIISIQQIEIQITGTAKSATYDLPIEVISADCWFVPGGLAGTDDTSNPGQTQAYIVHTSDTQMTAKRHPDGSPNGTVTAYGTLIHLAPGVIEKKEFEEFTVTATATTNRALSETFDLSRSFAVFHGINNQSNNSGVHGQMTAISMTGTQQVTAFGESLGAPVIAACTAYQFAAAYVEAVQHINEVIDTSTTGANIGISSTDATRTVMIWGGETSGSGINNWADYATSLNQNTDTNLQAGRQATASGNRRMCSAMVRLAPGIIEAIQRGITLMNNTISQTAAISESAQSHTVMFYSGFKSYTGATNGMHLLCGVKQTSNTQIQVLKGSAGTQVEGVWQAVRFTAS